MMIKTVNDIVGLEFDLDKSDRYVEVTVVTKCGDKVILNLEREMIAMLLLCLSEKENENND